MIQVDWPPNRNHEAERQNKLMIRFIAPLTASLILLYSLPSLPASLQMLPTHHQHPFIHYHLSIIYYYLSSTHHLSSTHPSIISPSIRPSIIYQSSLSVHPLSSIIHLYHLSSIHHLTSSIHPLSSIISPPIIT